ncbi:MAG: VWA domain-containing protein [Mariprofundales bacterium]|nr:VWA domain-containing protein [Mariprofundales bacterium]
MINFAWPWVAIALPLPLIIYHLLPRVERAEQPQVLQVPFADDIRHLTTSTPPHSHSARLSRVRLSIMVVVWLLLVIAAVRPQWMGDPIALPMKGRDIMLAVDLSGSMRIKDFSLQGRQVTRLTATKLLAADFIQRRTGDRVGLILFGDQAYIQAPLSFDRDTVQKLLMESAIGLAGKRTAIGDAIGLAVKHLSTGKSDNQVLILLTDGVNTAGRVSPMEAAGLAKKAGLRIYTIGIGANQMLQQGFFGTTQINPSADLDEKMLTDIAAETGGAYFRAHSSGEMAQIYRDIDTIEPIAHDKQFFRPVTELLCYPLGAAFLLLLTWMTTALRTARR